MGDPVVLGISGLRRGRGGNRGGGVEKKILITATEGDCRARLTV